MHRVLGLGCKRRLTAAAQLIDFHFQRTATRHMLASRLGALARCQTAVATKRTRPSTSCQTTLVLRPALCRLRCRLFTCPTQRPRKIHLIPCKQTLLVSPPPSQADFLPRSTHTLSTVAADMADKYIPEHRRTTFKAKSAFKPDELRRRREEQQVEIRRAKREENLAKRRGIGGGADRPGASLGAAPDSDDEGGNIEGQVSIPHHMRLCSTGPC